MKRVFRFGQRVSGCLSLRPVGRFWRSFWTSVCERSPNLCRRLEAIRKTIFRYDPEALEAQIAALCLGAAVWMVAKNLRVSGTASVAHLLMSLLPWWFWVTLFAGMGLSHISALALNHLQWRAMSAIAGVLAWSFVAVLMMLDGIIGPGTTLFPVIAASEAWVYLRLTTCCFATDSLAKSPDETDVTIKGEPNGSFKTSVR